MRTDTRRFATELVASKPKKASLAIQSDEPFSPIAPTALTGAARETALGQKSKSTERIEDENDKYAKADVSR